MVLNFVQIGKFSYLCASFLIEHGAKVIRICEYTKHFKEKCSHLIIFLLVMTINERFEAVIQVLFGGNKRAFALHVGISPTVVENVVGTRKGKPSFDVLEKVCANANISAEWLLLGKGEMLMDMFEIRKPMIFHSDDTLYENNTQEDAEDKPIARLATSPGEGIPLIPIEAMAGALTCEQTVLEYECERYVVPVFKGQTSLSQLRVQACIPNTVLGILWLVSVLP